MKLATYRTSMGNRIGAVRGEMLYPLSIDNASIPNDMVEFLSGGIQMLALATRVLDKSEHGIALSDIRLAPPISRPGKYLGIGMNYSSHIEELRLRGKPVADSAVQHWFNKQTSCITGPYDPVHLPAVSHQLDYEGELGVVIGRRCRHVRAEDAGRVIAGYLVANDLSVRDWQYRSATATLGKSFDTHGPIGPWITTADEIPEPHSLSILTSIDGSVVQEGNTSEMLARIPEMIAYLTTVMTLEPGDILCTGSPGGTGVGHTPPRWLHAGQKVRVEIAGLGSIENKVVDEPITQTTVPYAAL